MSRGLGKLQRKILLMLQTKRDPHRPERACFSTDEVISEFSLDYRLWLQSTNVFGESARARNRLRRHESLRNSHHRALQGLEGRGLVASYFHDNSRWWGVPERMSELDKKWVENDREYKELRQAVWKQGWVTRKTNIERRAKWAQIIYEREQVALGKPESA
jgi:hypothetical protein